VSARLYLITPPAFDPAAFAPLLQAALDGGDVACLQLRLKEVDDDTIRRAADVLRPIAQTRDVAFIMNDRPDLALASGSDGVHVGQEDSSYADARKLLGPDKIVGVTCYNSRDLAIDAAEAGADYVAFGGFFRSTTKDTRRIAGNDPELLRWWSEIMTVPSCAIGGITPENCGVLVEAGADFLAVIAAVWDHPQGPAAAVKAFNAAIKAVRPSGSAN
jgi:thiamine-phosphate pyrophosphorylase